MFKFGPVEAVALSASGTKSTTVEMSFYKRLGWQAELLRGMSRGFVHDQRFLEFTKKNQLCSVLPQGLCAGYMQGNVITGQGNCSLPVQVKVGIC